MKKHHDLKVGDVIAAYQAGYHVVIEIEPRSENSDLIHYKRLLDKHGKKYKTKQVLVCDVAWCSKVTTEMVEKIIDYDLEYFETKKKNLLELINAERSS